jgi:hypothetical protein
MATSCACSEVEHAPRLVVLTGGPGAGKTAVLEVVRQHFCRHIAVLPETASILFGGGFPRRPGPLARRAAQRAIYRVQVELERLVIDERAAAVVLCDRGTVDGLAYWDGPPESFWSEVGTRHSVELSRYAAVIHLCTPSATQGYNLDNPVRTENAVEASMLDERILAAWADHPRRVVIESADDFTHKLALALTAIRAEVPPCCRTHGPSITSS